MEDCLIPHRQYHPAKLRAPVADVVLPDDLIAFELQHAADRVPDDSASQMSNVHLLGDVGTRIIDHHGPRRWRRLDPQPWISRDFVQMS